MTQGGEKLRRPGESTVRTGYLRVLVAFADQAGSDLGDLQQVDMLAAKEQLIASRENSLQHRSSGMAISMTEYVALTPSIARLPGNEGALYLCRMKSLHVPENPKPAKGAVPRAKQLLVKKLNLPTNRYIHALKLEDGKFEDFRIVQLVPLQVPHL